MEGDMREISNAQQQEEEEEEEEEEVHVLSLLGIQVSRETTGAALAAAKITFSAIFYLLDFGTTLIALKTYYYYNFDCYKNLVNDPACVRMQTSNNNYASAFVACLSLIILPHLSNSLIFWMTLSPNDHPLRLAYFLPLIHLSRLLNVFWQTFSCNNRLKDLYDRQQESSSLYNILGASLETVPQLILQFHIAITLGNYSSSLEGPIPIPRTLIFSLLASMLTGTYNGSMAGLSYVPNYTLIGKVYITISAGVHTIAVMTVKAIMVAALTTPYHSAVWLITYACVSIIFPWIFSSVLLKIHSNSFTSNNKCPRPIQSFVLAHVSLFIGPMYVIVKYFRRSPYLYCILILGTLVQIVVEVLGIGGVLVIGRYLPYSGIPCRPTIWKSHNDNKYLTCHSFLGVVCPSLLLIIITSLIFIMVDKGEERIDDEMEIFSTNPCQSFNDGAHQWKDKALLPTRNREQTLIFSILIFFILRDFLSKIVHQRSSNHRSNEKQVDKDVLPLISNISSPTLSRP